MTKEKPTPIIEAIARTLVGAAPGAGLTPEQIAAGAEFEAVLAARGFAVTDKGDVRMLESIRRLTGGEHPTDPGQWHASNGTGGRWVELSARGQFCPAEAREIAHALIVFANQAENARR